MMSLPEQMLDELLERAKKHIAAGLEIKAAMKAAGREMSDTVDVYGEEMIAAVMRRLAEMKLH
jgi:hypothetical protein